MLNETIAIDMDEVLSPFVFHLVNWYNQTYQTQFKFEQFTTYDFSTIWGGTKEQTVAICDSFHRSRKIEDIQPVAGAVAALTLLAQQFNLVLVTSRPLQHKDYTHSWIDHHLKDIFAEIILCNHWTATGKAIKKSEVCKQIKAKYFIDDLPFYIEEVASCDIQCFLFGNYPWNKQPISKENVRRVAGWDDILNHLNIPVSS